MESFYDQLQDTLNHGRSGEVKTVMGDMNEKVDLGPHGNLARPFRLGEQNGSGVDLAEWCDVNRPVIASTWFEQPLRRRHTWVSPCGQYRNQILFALSNDFDEALPTSKLTQV